MKQTTGTIKLGDRTFSATENDFDDYDVESGYIEVTQNGVTTKFTASKNVGVEDD